MEYAPTSDDSQFFLNSGAPANIDGTVSRVRYCHILQTSTTATLLQATVGFYRRSGNTFTLTNSFNITKSATSAPISIFQCENLSISPIQVNEGDVIGVCSRDFESSLIGRIILVANTISNANGDDSLFRNVPSDSLCSQEGHVPQDFTRSQVERVPENTLLLYANISTCKAIQLT